MVVVERLSMVERLLSCSERFERLLSLWSSIVDGKQLQDFEKAVDSDVRLWNQLTAELVEKHAPESQYVLGDRRPKY